MKKPRSFSAVQVGWGMFILMAFVIVAQVIVICRQYDAQKPSVSRLATLSGSDVYKGLPLGADELNEYLEYGHPEYASRLLTAYQAGRLQVSGRVYSPRYAERFAQTVRPLVTEGADFMAEPECGYYGGPCELVLGDRLNGDGVPRLIPNVVGKQGYQPVEFLDEDTVLLRGGFGDGPCGVAYYKALDFVSGSSTHAFEQSVCYEEAMVSLRFAAGEADEEAKELLTMSIRPSDPAVSIGDGNTYDVFIVEGETVRQVLRKVVVPEETKEKGPYVWIVPDVKAYFANQMQLKVTINGKAYTFDIPTN